MEFRIQEIIKMLIPGTVLFTSLYLLLFQFIDTNLVLNEDFVAIYLVIFLGLIYVIGYFIDWFGSLFERLFYSVFPRPSYSLFTGQSKRITLTKRTEIVTFLGTKSGANLSGSLNKKDALALFKYANVYKDKNDSVKDKVTESYFSKIFSRNLCVSFILTFLGYIFLYFFLEIPFNYFSFLMLVLFFFSWIRWQEHTFYYTRKVIYAACDDIL